MVPVRRARWRPSGAAGFPWEQISRPSAPHLGWACLLAWVFCAFYLRATERALAGFSAAESRLQAMDAAGPLATVVQNGSSLSVSIVVLCVIALCSKKIAPIADRKRLVVACSATVALGTLFVCAPDAAGAWGTVQFWFGEVLTGVGSAPLWVMWGELYARLDRGTCETSAAVATVVAGLFTLVCISLDGWLSLAMVVAFPVAAGATALSCVRVGDGNVCVPGADRAKISRDVALARTLCREGLGILVASMVICYAGRFVPDETPLGVYQAALACAIAVAAAIALIGILTPRRFNLQFLYRWMCPFIMVSLACLIWFPGIAGQTFSFVGSISARLAFCLITQVSFAQIAAERGLTPTRAFALGWVCLHLGDLAGVVLGLVLDGPATTPVVQAGYVVGVLTVLVASVMLALNGRNSFGWAPDGGCVSWTDGVSPNAPLSLGPDGISVVDDRGRRVDRLAVACELTAREAQILRLLAAGRSNPYIRDELGVSLNTVGTHVKHVYAKLGVHSRQELIDLVDKEGPSGLTQR